MKKILFPLLLLTSCASFSSIENRVRFIAQFDVLCYSKDIQLEYLKDEDLYKAECEFNGRYKQAFYKVYQNKEIRKMK